MTPGRERGLTALLCAAGAGLAVLAAGRPWATVHARDAITPLTYDLTGRALGHAAGALGLGGLAGLAALFATRGRVRVVIGALMAAFGAGIVYASVTAVQRSHVLMVAAEKSLLLRLGANPAIQVNLWWMVSVTGGVLIVIAGAIAMVRGPRWRGMSARYERPATAARPAGRGARQSAPKDDHSALWKSLDRGEDPTMSQDDPFSENEAPGGDLSPTRWSEGPASRNGRP